MRSLRLFAIFVFSALVALTVAAPQILIVGVAPPGTKKPKQEVTSLADALIEYAAQEFDADGRLHPIAWSVTDPYFRIAVDSGRIKKNDNPGLKEVFKAADELHVEYVMTVTIWPEQGQLMAYAQLYKNGQAVWRDPSPNDPSYQAALINQRNAAVMAKKQKKAAPQVDVENGRIIGISNTGQDQDNTIHSLARTWVVKLADSVFKPFAAHPAIGPAPVDPGPKPVTATPPPAPPQKLDNKDLMANVMKLLGDHKNAEAIAALRDAVDLSPMDVERRRALINTLSQSGQPQMAATEAQRAAAIMPDKVEFRVLAARNFLAAGQSDTAMQELKEAVARDPNGVETRRLLGEIDLSQLKLEDAITQFDFVLSKDQSPDAYYDRALARCLSGNGEGASQDYEAAKKSGLITGGDNDTARYAELERILDKTDQDYGSRSRVLLQHAKVKPDDPSVAADNGILLKRASAEIAFLSLVGVPDNHKRSCDTRLLALKLLVQCYTDLEDYVKQPDDDVLADATISLGEGLKDLDQALSAYSGENDKG